VCSDADGLATLTAERLEHLHTQLAGQLCGVSEPFVPIEREMHGIERQIRLDQRANTLVVQPCEPVETTPDDAVMSHQQIRSRPSGRLGGRYRTVDRKRDHVAVTVTDL